MELMEFQFQQGLGSSSANPEAIAHLFRGDFAGRRTFSSSRRTPRSESAVVRLEFDEVVDRIKRGDRLTPQDAVSAFNLGFAHRTLGRWLDSAEAFTTALEFTAKSDEKHRDYNLAAIHFMRGYSYGSLASKQKGRDARKNLERAKADYLKALDLKKDYMLVYCHLGVLYSVQRRWQEMPLL
jgi:tetratricopeptide (TPR) repeat protein